MTEAAKPHVTIVIRSGGVWRTETVTGFQCRELYRTDALCRILRHEFFDTQLGDC
jgi:hypothetical protein